MPIPEIETQIQSAYAAVPQDVREDLAAAFSWAITTLRDYEGGGHILQLHGHKSGGVMCTFSKTSWPGEHQSRPMETGSEALVMAVCEYMNGA